MGTTTFSGPIKAGTIKETTGTTVGSDMKNTGQVVMAQTHAVDLSGGALAAVASNVIIPANSSAMVSTWAVVMSWRAINTLSYKRMITPFGLLSLSILVTTNRITRQGYGHLC